MNMNSIQFTKMNGAGNDFIVIDSIENETVNLTPSIIRRLCDRSRGIGADGILHLKQADRFDYELIYYNSNGLPGSLCANGSRCSIKYAGDYLLKDKVNITFICT
jgi:diaminopimelate epimerase